MGVGESGGRKRRNDAWGGMGREWEWNSSGKGVVWMRRWMDQETGGGEGSKRLTKMSSSNAKQWVQTKEDQERENVIGKMVEVGVARRGRK